MGALEERNCLVSGIHEENSRIFDSDFKVKTEEGEIDFGRIKCGTISHARF